MSYLLMVANDPSLIPSFLLLILPESAPRGTMEVFALPEDLRLHPDV